MAMDIIPGPNLVVSTAPVGDSSDKPASTQFVTNAIAAIPAPTPPCFSVTKSGTQTGVVSATETQVTFDTEIYDVGSFFASSVWTPTAGKIALCAGFYADGTITAGTINTIAITKNGATTVLKKGTSVANTNVAHANVAIEDVANGTDAYGVSVNFATSAGTGTIRATGSETYFMGHWISV